MRVSPRSRRRFQDFCAGDGTVGLIATVFQAENVMPVEGYDSPQTGQRRFEVERHEAALDLTDDSDNSTLVRVYTEAVAEFGFDAFTGALTAKASALVNSLRQDGAPIDEQGRLTGPLPVSPGAALDLTDHARLASPEVLEAHIERINAGVRDDPDAAISSAKELVESVCKFVLEDYEVEYSTRDDLLALYKKAASALNLNAEAVPGSSKGSHAAQKALRSMATVVQSLAEMRNELGLGHGRTTKSPALARHARLTATLTTGLVQFMLDTWHVRRGDS